MHRRLFILLVVGMLFLALPSAGAATDPARGTANTSISLASISFTTPTGSTPDATTTVSLGVGSGFATTDPVRNSLDKLRAFFNLVPVSAVGVTQVATPAFNAKAESGSSRTTDSKADGYQPVSSASLLDGSVTATALSALVDPRVDAQAKSPLARASLGDALVDLDIGAGLVTIRNLRVAISSVVDTSRSDATQGIEIGSISVLPLSELLGRVGGLDPLVVADELVALAASFGGAGVAASLDDVLQERDAAVAAIDSCLGGADPAVCTPLSALGLTTLPTSTSVQDVLNYADSFASNCAILLAGLGALADAVCADVVPVITAAASNLPTLLQDLLDEIAPQSLLSVTNLVAKVGAEATDATATATATGGWGSAVVLGNDLAGVTDTANPSVAIDRISAELAKLEALLDDFPQLAGISLQIDPFFKEPVTGVDGRYRTARSSLSLLRVLVSLPAGVEAEFRAAAVGDPFTLDAKVLTLAGYAEHRPASEGRPGACSSNCLAESGPAPAVLRFTGGLALLTLGLSLRRWLGDAA